jgi:hypothetical protein
MFILTSAALTSAKPPPKKRKLDYEASEFKNINISPSSFSKPSTFRKLNESGNARKVYIHNRPIDFESVPLTLISPIFAHLSDDLFTNHEGLRWQDFAPARDLANKLSSLEPKEALRKTLFWDWLLEMLPNIQTDDTPLPSHEEVRPRLTTAIIKGELKSKSDYKTDGHVELRDNLILAVEARLELGELPSDPHWQLMAYVRAYYMQQRCKHRVGKSPLPAILIAFYGMFTL